MDGEILYRRAVLKNFLRNKNNIISQTYKTSMATKKFNEDEVYKLYLSSSNIQMKLAFIGAAKSIVKNAFLCVKNSYQNKIPLLQYITPEMITVNATEEEVLILLQNQQKQTNIESNANIFFVIVRRMSMELLGQHVTQLLNAMRTNITEESNTIDNNNLDDSSIQFSETSQNVNNIENDNNDNNQEMIITELREIISTEETRFEGESKDNFINQESDVLQNMKFITNPVELNDQEVTNYSDNDQLMADTNKNILFDDDNANSNTKVDLKENESQFAEALELSPRHDIENLVENEEDKENEIDEGNSSMTLDSEEDKYITSEEEVDSGTELEQCILDKEFIDDSNVYSDDEKIEYIEAMPPPKKKSNKKKINEHETGESQTKKRKTDHDIDAKTIKSFQQLIEIF